MWHAIFVAVHALTAISALIAGLTTLLQSRLFATYLSSLVAMEVFLVLAIAAQWTAYSGATRSAFAALAALGAVMVWRGARAWQSRPLKGDYLSERCFEHVGFTLVAIVNAFLVITVLNAGAPGWALVVTAVVVALVGHLALHIGARGTHAREQLL